MSDSKLKIWISDNVNLSGLQKLKSSLGTLQTSIKKAFNSAPVRLLRNAILGVGAALVGAVVEAVKFNVQIARVWTMAGGGIENFKKLREEARGLASDFGIARSEMAKGMYNALSAGVDKAGLESFMSIAAKVAVADGSDISTAVDGITAVLNAFKIEASETEAVADKMFQTVKTGKITFAELSANLGTVGATAASAGVPFEQILAHVAALTSLNVPAAQAMTQIRASILGLNKALGDGWSKNMSYQDALKAVWKQAGQSQTELLKLVGSTEAMMAVLGGVGENAGMATEKLKGMADSAGALGQAFWQVDQFRHWAPLLETVRGTLSKLGEEIDRRLGPYVRNVTAQIKQWRDDGGLWDKIGGVLDKAEGKLRQIAEVIMEIKSIEDLKVAGAAIGEKLTTYLLEKAAAIGGAIAQGIKDAFPLFKNIGEINRGISKTLEDALNMFSLGALGRMKEQAAGAQAAPSGSIRDQIVSAREARGPDVIASVKEGAKQGIQEASPASNEKSAIQTAGEAELKKTEKEVSSLERSAKSMGDIAAQLVEGKAREAALALQQEYTARIEEQKQLLKLQQDSVKLFQDQASAQGSLNEAFSSSIARLNSQLAAMRS